MNKNSEKTRAHILQAAAEIFAEKGFRAATVRQICAKADANIAAINYQKTLQPSHRLRDQ